MPTETGQWNGVSSSNMAAIGTVTFYHLGLVDLELDGSDMSRKCWEMCTGFAFESAKRAHGGLKPQNQESVSKRYKLQLHSKSERPEVPDTWL